MRLNSVVGFTSANASRGLAFGRAPKNGKEEREYTQSIQRGLDYLGVQNMSLILHGTSFPAPKDGYDISAGSPYGASEVVEFSKVQGFKQTQLGPNGRLNKGDTSPYTSSVFEKNPLFLNPQMLTTDDFAGILSEGDIKAVGKKTKVTAQNFARTDFKEGTNNKNELLAVAFNNFNEKLAQGNPRALELNEEFQAFQKQNASWLDYYSVLSTIAYKHDTDFYPNWPKEDRTLRFLYQVLLLHQLFHTLYNLLIL